MKTCFLLPVFLISFLFVRSQDFIVTHTGDTIRGNIHLLKDSVSIQQQGLPLLMVAADNVSYIKTHKRQGTLVHCNLITYSDNIDVVQKWDFKGGDEIDTVLVLNEIYSTPKMNLYEVSDKDRVTYFFIKKPTDRSPIQMMVHFFVPDNTGSGVFRYSVTNAVLTQNRIYADQLRAIMADCPKITNTDIEALDYRSYSFKKIIRRYNKCK